MNEFVTFLNLPPLPDWFIDSGRKIIDTEELDTTEYYGDILGRPSPADTVVINGQTRHYGAYFHKQLTALHYQWLRKNVLTIDFEPSTLNIIKSKGDLWPHQDHHVAWSLNFIVDTGGDRTETYWAQERGSLLRPGHRSVSYWRHHQELDEVYSVVLPARQWLLIPVDIIHGTKNQVGDRVSFTVKLNNDQANLLKKEYSL